MARTEEKAKLLSTIHATLTRGEFQRIEEPLTVSGLKFDDVTAAYESPTGSLELLIVIDATEGTEEQFRRGYWLMERIASALDHVKSRRSLTAVIMHNENSKRVPTEHFLRYGRVLLASHPSTVEADLAPILPISLEANTEVGRDPLDMIRSRVTSGADIEMRKKLIEAARVGPSRVEADFVEWIDSAFNTKREADE